MYRKGVSQSHRYEEPSYEVEYCEGCGSAADPDPDLKICAVCQTKGAHKMAVNADDREFLQLAGIEQYNVESIRISTGVRFALLMTETNLRGRLPHLLRGGTTEGAGGED